MVRKTTVWILQMTRATNLWILQLTKKTWQEQQLYGFLNDKNDNSNNCMDTSNNKKW